MTLELDEQKIKRFLEMQKETNLADHYSFKNSIVCNFDSANEVVAFIKSNNPINIEIKDGELYYTLDNKMDKDELFTVKTESSFSHSNVWLYDKIIQVELVYPNISEAAASSEMVSFYICLIVASVLRSEFLIEFLEIIKSYNFKKWVQDDEFSLNFNELSREWIQIGSETVKMITAAAKYAISRNEKKKELPSVLDLPEDMVSAYNSLRRTISDVRYEFDRIKLSSSNREKMTSLEIKVLISERDIKIQELITTDRKLHEVWRLTNLNSNVIEPGVLRGYTLSSRKESLSFFKELYGRSPDLSSNEDLINLKKFQNKLKREAIRATLNKIFKHEVIKFKNNQEGYIAPPFV
jgi:hypothetical protein